MLQMIQRREVNRGSYMGHSSCGLGQILVVRIRVNFSVLSLGNAQTLLRHDWEMRPVSLGGPLRSA